MRLKLLAIAIFVISVFDVMAEPIDVEIGSSADCYDYSFDPPQYILGMCDPLINDGIYGDRPFDPPTGWEWQFIQCMTCPPGYGDWTLIPINSDPIPPASPTPDPVDTPDPFAPSDGYDHGPAVPITENDFLPAAPNPVDTPDPFVPFDDNENRPAVPNNENEFPPAAPISEVEDSLFQ